MYVWQSSIINGKITQQGSIKRSEMMQHHHMNADSYSNVHNKNPRNAPHHHQGEEEIWAQWREQQAKRPWEWRKGHPWSSDCIYSWKGIRYASNIRNKPSSVFNARERERKREKQGILKMDLLPAIWALSHLGGQCVFLVLVHLPCLFLCVFGGSYLHSFKPSMSPR